MIDSITIHIHLSKEALIFYSKEHSLRHGPIADRARLRRETGTDLIKFPAVGGIFPGIALRLNLL